jgi:flagellar L-ring protein precursor FlgH
MSVNFFGALRGGCKPPAQARARKKSCSALAATAALLVCVPADAPAQSLWKHDQPQSMFADRRARAVGDIITIVVQESNIASKDNSTKTSRKAGADFSIASFLYGPAASGLLTKGGAYPALKYSGSKDFNGGGSVQNTEKIDTRVAVRVMEVLPNNNLVVEGRRELTFSGETQEAVLRGTVRIEDVTTANTVMSYNVADATKRGWFSRAIDKINPF